MSKIALCEKDDRPELPLRFLPTSRTCLEAAAAEARKQRSLPRAHEAVGKQHSAQGLH